MMEKTKDGREEPLEAEESTEETEVAKEGTRFEGIYSKVASNGYENLRTSYIENKAKELRKRRK